MTRSSCSQSVQSAARGVVEAAQDEQGTGPSDAQWWAARSPLLAQLVFKRYTC